MCCTCQPLIHSWRTYLDTSVGVWSMASQTSGASRRCRPFCAALRTEMWGNTESVAFFLNWNSRKHTSHGVNTFRKIVTCRGEQWCPTTQCDNTLGRTVNAVSHSYRYQLSSWSGCRGLKTNCWPRKVSGDTCMFVLSYTRQYWLSTRKNDSQFIEFDCSKPNEDQNLFSVGVLVRLQSTPSGDFLKNLSLSFAQINSKWDLLFVLCWQVSMRMVEKLGFFVLYNLRPDAFSPL